MPHGMDSAGFWRDAYEDIKRAADADIEGLTVERDHYRVAVNNLTAELRAATERARAAELANEQWVEDVGREVEAVAHYKARADAAEREVSALPDVVLHFVERERGRVVAWLRDRGPGLPSTYANAIENGDHNPRRLAVPVPKVERACESCGVRFIGHGSRRYCASGRCAAARRKAGRG